LGHPLDPDNSGRYSIRGGERSLDLYWAIVRSAVQCWVDCDAPAAVNVKDFIHEGTLYPLADRWARLMRSYGYQVGHRVQVGTPGMRNGRNREARSSYEEILVCRRPVKPPPDQRRRTPASRP
jgi:hypothetical protein